MIASQKRYAHFMKILHTADWHIGRQFHNVSLLEDQRHVLDQLIAVIREEKVEAVIIAGDVYDRSVPPTEAVDLLDEPILSLRQLGDYVQLGLTGYNGYNLCKPKTKALTGYSLK